MRTLMIVLVVAIAACSGSDDIVGTPASRVAVIEPLTPTSLTAMVGTVIRPFPRVRVLSVEGKPVVGELVTFTAMGGRIRGEAVVRSDASGIAEAQGWELETAPGPHRLVARAGNAEATFTADAHVGPLTTLAAVDDTSVLFGAVRSTVTRRLQVRATDTYRNPIAGVEVIFGVNGGGVVTDTSVLTGPDGIATAGEWTLGPDEGSQSVVAMRDTFRVEFRAVACALPCPMLLYENNGNIHRFDFASGRSDQLTSEGTDRDPAWSRDGEWIAFARSEARPIGMYPTSIYIMAADDVTNVRRITHAGWFHSPTWSPDGAWLALAGDRADCWSSCSVYTLAVATDEAPRPIAGAGTDPAWSPDGSKIAYVSLVGDDLEYAENALHAVSPDGSRSWELLRRSAATITDPNWSPDGRRIAFSTCDVYDRCQILTSTADGSATQPLTSVAAWGPAWSADGRYIAVTTPQGIGLIPAAGGMPIYLGVHGSSIAWRP